MVFIFFDRSVKWNTFIAIHWWVSNAQSVYFFCLFISNSFLVWKGVCFLCSITSCWSRLSGSVVYPCMCCVRSRKQATAPWAPCIMSGNLLRINPHACHYQASMYNVHRLCTICCEKKDIVWADLSIPSLLILYKSCWCCLYQMSSQIVNRRVVNIFFLFFFYCWVFLFCR